MKRELIYAAVIGGVVGAVLVMAAGSLAPLGAQNEAADAEFGTITCSKLVVRYDGSPYATEIDPLYVKVSVDGEESATLGTRGLSVVGKEGKSKVYVKVYKDGGVVSVYGKDGGVGARMAIDENGGVVRVFGKDGGGSAVMATSEDGGAVHVFDKDGERWAQMAIDGYGGSVYVSGKDGGGEARMAIDENGGGVAVYGKGNSDSRAVMGVNEYGNGAVSTWDKNGYRFKTLK